MPEQQVVVPAAGVELEADLALPDGARGLIIFAHGSGSSRHSPRNRAVAARLREAGFGTVLADLLTAAEERADTHDGHLRFDIGLLAGRLVGLLDWARADARTGGLAVGLFGASTGAAAALVAAATRPDAVGAVVSRGGRPDLAGDALAYVRAPTLLLVGGADSVVADLNREAARNMVTAPALHLIPGATHLFEEPGALADVAERAAGWFTAYLAASGAPARAASAGGGDPAGRSRPAGAPDPAGTSGGDGETRHAPVVFMDRTQAGTTLAVQVADHLRRRGLPGRPLVLALPRGGVPVGAEVSREIHADLDIVVARKIGVPWHPEFGVGAVTGEGPPMFDQATMRQVGLTTDDLNPLVARERVEARRRERTYRGDRPLPQLAGRVVVVVDDGLATGVTARAALRAVRRQEPRHLAFAAPVCAGDAAELLAAEADAVLCARQPAEFLAVGRWYRDFGQLDDAEVCAILDQAWRVAAT